MALTPEERKIVEYGQSQGKSREQVLSALAKYRTAQPQAKKPGVLSSEGAIGKAAQGTVNFLGGKAVADTFGSEIAKIGATPDERRILSQTQPGIKETAGSALMLGSTLVPGAKAGAGLLSVAGAGAAGGYLYDVGSNLQQNKGALATLTPGAGTVTGAVAAPALQVGVNALGRGAQRFIPAGRRVAQEAVEGAAGAGQRGTQLFNEALQSNPTAAGLVQTGEEFLERVPRFVGRVGEGVQDAATRAERIRTSPPAVGNAIKSGLDDRITNTLVQADPATIKAYREVVDIAEQAGDTLKPKQRPEIVAGRAAADQYATIEAQRRTVGKQIGEATKQLSRDTAVPMQPAYQEMESVLREAGVVPTYTDSGVKLDFSKTKFTKAQRSRVQELYDLATEGGDTLTPAQIYTKDQLFSQLQRETRMEGIGDILIDVPGQDKPMSLFRVFRDVYANTLDAVSPEDIRALNRQYRNLVTLQDDIENSIIKSGNFESSKNVDPAEFAQTNLRRLFSDAQSAANYREIASEMDAISRQLGYDGASPEDVAAFAAEMRNIYPDTKPATGFSAGIRSGVADIVGQVFSAGQADTRDQQRALRALIESLSQ